MLLGVGWGWGRELVSYLGAQSLFIFFLIKENWICPMTRHHAEPNINILLTRNPHLDSDVRHWSHPLMIPLHCLWATSNNRTRGQIECDATWLVRLQLNEKKSGQERLISLYWKWKSTWRKDLVTDNSHLWIMFSFNWLFIIWRRWGWGNWTS